MLFFYFLWMYVATVVAIFLQKVMVSASPIMFGPVLFVAAVLTAYVYWHRR